MLVPYRTAPCLSGSTYLTTLAPRPAHLTQVLVIMLVTRQPAGQMSQTNRILPDSMPMEREWDASPGPAATSPCIRPRAGTLVRWYLSQTGLLKRLRQVLCCPPRSCG